jgi:hypothetical protein
MIHQSNLLNWHSPREESFGTTQGCQIDCRTGTPIQYSGEASTQIHDIQSQFICCHYERQERQADHHGGHSQTNIKACGWSPQRLSTLTSSTKWSLDLHCKW